MKGFSLVKQDFFKMFAGITAVLFSGYIVVTENYELMSFVLVQSVMGLVISGLVKFGISSFEAKKKLVGSFYIIAAALLFVTVIAANDLSLMGILPLMVILIIFGAPIGIMAMFHYHFEHKKQLLK